jgi:hypothetical protein
MSDFVYIMLDIGGGKQDRFKLEQIAATCSRRFDYNLDHSCILIMCKHPPDLSQGITDAPALHYQNLSPHTRADCSRLGTLVFSP